jgi:hypothetical protein
MIFLPPAVWFNVFEFVVYLIQLYKYDPRDYNINAGRKKTEATGGYGTCHLCG